MLPLLVALAICIPVIFLWGAAHWIWVMATSVIGLIGFAYPTVKSFQALRKRSFKDFHHMVVYWFVYSLVTALNTKMALFVAAVSGATTFGVLTPVILSMIPVSLGPARLYGYFIGFLRFLNVHLPIPMEDKQEIERGIRDAQAGKPTHAPAQAQGPVPPPQHAYGPVPHPSHAQHQPPPQAPPQPQQPQTQQQYRSPPPPYAYPRERVM